MASFRLFIAVNVPPEVRRALKEYQNALAASGADVRWEREEKLHCTLHFLGQVDETLVEPLCSAVARASHGSGSFTVRYHGTGFFPDASRARIVWVGIEDPGGTLARLHAGIGSGVSALGIATEDLPFHPHVTLGRIRTPRNFGRLTTIVETRTFDHPPVPVREVDILRSELHTGGSVYTVLRSIPLTR